MFGLGPSELIIIAVIILILFGARKIPDIGKGLGGALREFKNIKKEISSSPAKETEDKGKKDDKEDKGEEEKEKTEEKNPGLLEEGIKKHMLNKVPGARKAIEIKDKVKKVNEIIK